MAQLAIRSVLGDGPFADSGRVSGVYWNRQHDQVAVASSFESLCWHGRDCHMGCALKFRVSIYDLPSLRRIATLDQAQYPINAVAFHPSDDLVAVAAGRYDGGYFYEGELLLWNPANGEVVSLLDETREVTNCQFDDTGQVLNIILRPATDEEEGYAFLQAKIEAQAWQPLRARSAPVQSFSCIPVSASSEHEGYPAQEGQSVDGELESLAQQIGQHFEPRWFVWDVAWTAGGDILAVRNSTALEHWTADGERRRHIPDQTDGVQLLVSPDGNAYVNLSSTVYKGGWALLTHVEHIEVDTGKRQIVETGGVAALLSMDQRGAILARDTESDRLYAVEVHTPVREYTSEGPAGFRIAVPERRLRPTGHTLDRVLLPARTADQSLNLATGWRPLHISKALDLGHYDIFNHYLRVDEAPDLYFIQGTPPTSWKDRWVCRINALTLQSERLFPIDWDPSTETHISIDASIYLPDDGLGPGMIVGCRRTDARGFCKHGAQLVRRNLTNGNPIWITSFDTPMTALALLDGGRRVIFALADGHVGVAANDTGAVQLLCRVSLDGVVSPYLSLAVRGTHIAAGTLDGRIVLSELTD